MRIVIINDYAFVNGGAGRVAIDSAIGLANKGIQVDFFAAVGPVQQELTDAGINVTVLNQQRYSEMELRKALKQSLDNKLARETLAKLLSGMDPKDTVIHLHSWRDSLSASIMDPIQEKGFRWVVTAHDYALACPYSGFYDYTRDKICTKTAMSFDCITCRCNDGSFLRKSLSTYRQYVQTRQFGLPSRATDIITVGPFSQKILTPYFPENVRIHQVNNPIGVTQEPRVTAEMNSRLFVIGRLSVEKDPAFAAEAARQAGVPISFIGDGPLAESLKRDYPEAEFLGWLQPDDVVREMKRARALLFPSKWYETQGMTAYEATAMGVPILVSSVSATTQAVERYDNGYVFLSRDIDGLVKLINELKDDELAAQFSHRGYDRYWADPLTLDRHLGQLMATYTTVLSPAASDS